jgi:hypothetical protein
MTTEQTKSPEQIVKDLIADMTKAIAENRIDDIIKLGKQIAAQKGEVNRLEAERIKAEAQALAGVREKAATLIHSYLVNDKRIAKLLADTKSLGFTFKLDTAEVNYKSVALTVPTAPTAKHTGGGGGGKSQAEFGMKLDEIFAKFATDEQKAEVSKVNANAEEKVKVEPDAGKHAAIKHAANSKTYQIKIDVKRKAIADGNLKPVAK